jgi:hypothetical protein
MPKASVDEDGNLLPGKEEIRSAWQVGPMQLPSCHT